MPLENTSSENVHFIFYIKRYKIATKNFIFAEIFSKNRLTHLFCKTVYLKHKI